MAVVSNGLFTPAERAFTDMLERGAVLVGDRWFPEGSTELERARYLVSYHNRLERNRRRRERRRERASEARPRNVCGTVPMDLDSQRAHRDPVERRKCLRRATVAPCPTANEIRTAWHCRDAGPAARLRLAALLLDLECYVDNSLKVRKVRNRPLIVGRAPGIRGWIRENCPELGPKYKTLMRIKGMGGCLRQNTGLPDPVPLEILLDPSLDPASLADLPLQVQPRGDEEDDETTPGLVTDRYVWERSEIRIDANGRPYRDDGNYRLVANTPACCRTASARLAALQAEFTSIVLNGTGDRTIENYTAPRGRLPSRPSVRRRMEAFRAGLREKRADMAGPSLGNGGRFAKGIRERGLGEEVLAALEWYLTIPNRMRRMGPVIPPSELSGEW